MKGNVVFALFNGDRILPLYCRAPQVIHKQYRPLSGNRLQPYQDSYEPSDLALYYLHSSPSSMLIR